MGQLEDLRAFVQIVEHESIGKAAEVAGIAKSAMSRRLRMLEERMQCELITRTTRQWALTEAGRQFYERGLNILHAYDEFEGQIRNDTRELKGEVRLSVPLYFGKTALTEPLTEFAQQYPNVHLTVDFSDRLVDVIGESYDLVVRISDLPDSSLIARKLCVSHHVCCASPSYLAQAQPILEPHDLQQHRIMKFGVSRRGNWTFSSPAGKPLTVSLSAAINSLDGGFLIDAAERGLGVIHVPDFMARASLASGRLVQVLGDYAPDPLGVFVVYPATRYLPHRTRTLMDHLLARVSRSWRSVDERRMREQQGADQTVKSPRQVPSGSLDQLSNASDQQQR